MYQKTQISACVEIDENPLISAVPWVWAHTGLHSAQEVAALQRGAGVMTAWVWMRAAGQGSTSSRWGQASGKFLSSEHLSSSPLYHSPQQSLAIMTLRIVESVQATLRCVFCSLLNSQTAPPLKMRMEGENIPSTKTFFFL